MNQTYTATRASLILRLNDAKDVAAWDQFASIYGPVVYRVALRRGLQTADAENLVQEVFLSVAKSINAWLDREDRGRFRAWLLTIARNEAIDMLTRRATRPLGRDGAAAEQLLGQLPAPDEFSHALDLEYERAVFRSAADKVRELVEQHTWDAFCLTKVEGLSVSEAAQRLDMRPANVRLARSRVMARIKKIVIQYEASE